MWGFPILKHIFIFVSCIILTKHLNPVGMWKLTVMSIKGKSLNNCVTKHLTLTLYTILQYLYLLTTRAILFWSKTTVIIKFRCGDRMCHTNKAGKAQPNSAHIGYCKGKIPKAMSHPWQSHTVYNILKSPIHMTCMPDLASEWSQEPLNIAYSTSCKKWLGLGFDLSELLRGRYPSHSTLLKMLGFQQKPRQTFTLCKCVRL